MKKLLIITIIVLSTFSVSFAANLVLGKKSVVCVSEDAAVQFNYYQFQNFQRAASLLNTVCTQTKYELPVEILNYGRGGNVFVRIVNTTDTAWTDADNVNRK